MPFVGEYVFNRCATIVASAFLSNFGSRSCSRAIYQQFLCYLIFFVSAEFCLEQRYVEYGRPDHWPKNLKSIAAAKLRKSTEKAYLRET